MFIRKIIVNCIGFAMACLGVQSILAASKYDGVTRETLPILSGWQFRKAGEGRWYAATVPGCVHTDLLQNGLIGDPFWGENEQTLQWIDKQFWIYEAKFNVPPDMLLHQNITLVFEGLDTYATVLLNGQRVLEADNMFREWRVSCRSLLKPADNVLTVQFSSPINKVLPFLRTRKQPLPAVNDRGEGTSPYTRKAPYQYGWDWGPRLVTSGIWKAVYLEAWDAARIAGFQVRTEKVSDTSAELSAILEIEASTAMEGRLVIECLSAESTRAEANVKLSAGRHEVTVSLRVSNPRLWWPNGLGSQPLYKFRSRLQWQGRTLDEYRLQVGLRTLGLVQEVDGWGRSFRFKVNGLPLFAKGGNWIPADSFPTRVTPEKYRQLLQSCRDAHMNILRVWGGGIYERDEFYDLCDELGILVWQDFIYSCALYPGTEVFLKSAEQEAIGNVRRLRSHPCLALWCGNNEVETGWFDWGWKKKYPSSFWEDYRRLFLDLLPDICRRLDPQRPYWPSSPSSGLQDAPNSEKSGDVHFWGVWHGDLPYKAYEDQHPRFLSEYGFQSFPAPETLKAFASAQDLSVNSPAMLWHQKTRQGNQRIVDSIGRYYSPPQDFGSLVYLSQVLQAEAVRTGAEHLRRSMPRCMGSLYWQVNDCWPGITWSGIDYFGRWKAMQYYARRFYSDVLLSFQVERDRIRVFVVSDKPTAAPVTLHLRLLDFGGNSLLENRKELEIPPLDSHVVTQLSLKEILAGRDPRRAFLAGELVVAGKSIFSNSHFFAEAKDIEWPKSTIRLVMKSAVAGPLIEVRSDKLARSVYLSCEGMEGRFSDNFFDVLPDRPVEVRFESNPPSSIERLQQAIRVRSLAGVHQIHVELVN